MKEFLKQMKSEGKMSEYNTMNEWVKKMQVVRINIYEWNEEKYKETYTK